MFINVSDSHNLVPYLIISSLMRIYIYFYAPEKSIFLNFQYLKVISLWKLWNHYCAIENDLRVYKRRLNCFCETVFNARLFSILKLTLLITALC